MPPSPSPMPMPWYCMYYRFLMPCMQHGASTETHLHLASEGTEPVKVSNNGWDPTNCGDGPAAPSPQPENSVANPWNSVSLGGYESSSTCLDIAGGEAVNGAAIQLWDCNG